jgi:N-carbamoylputrescine amidase
MIWMDSRNGSRDESMQRKKLIVSAIQPDVSASGSISDNLHSVESLVKEAKAKGAELILLPEFLPTGYCLEPAIWGMAEPENGETSRWLSSQASESGVWIGTSFLEAEGNDFFNTFVLASPEGQEVARVRKSTPAASERYFFKGDEGTRCADTPFGRIGISICYEALLSSTLADLRKNKVDLVLMPMSAPVPTLNSPLKQKDLDDYTDTIRNLAPTVSKELGVPSVMANKVGAWKTNSPWPLPRENSHFPGLSVICDAGGRELARIEGHEGVIISEIELDTDRRNPGLPSASGKWARPVPKVFKLLIVGEILGAISYFFSRIRKQAAIKVSGKFPR